MSRPDRSAVLHHLVQVLDDPAPINAGHALHVRSLIRRVLIAETASPVTAATMDDSRAPDAGHGGPSSGGSAWAVSGTPDRLAAIAPEDPMEESPAL